MRQDVIIIGGGHAGCEAALAAARLGLNTTLFTLNLDAIALMPCNPSIGGTGKGHLVREVDALGGEMGLNIDDTMLQSRMLNTGKGPAVHSLRAQADKVKYQTRMKRILFQTPNLTVRQGEVSEILTGSQQVTGIKLATGEVVQARAVVLATGVYLNASIIIGDQRWQQGPQGLSPACFLSRSLTDLGFVLRRFKTGTPARVDARSIDFDAMEVQQGDDPVTPFSFLTDRPLCNTDLCYMTHTNETTHQIIRDNLHRSPMYSGLIKGTGARYCPSIEDKVHRFSDKTSHQLFLEPETKNSLEWYVQGMSTSLPGDVQLDMYRSIRGLERCVLTRLAYAIEYDCLDPITLSPTLAVNDIAGLYSAGQINGTSGYEEAAAQGLIAGINAALYVKSQEPLLLTRDMAYIGVLTDDLTSKGTDEPYRIMTSRAEHRLLLRQDNADLRLTPLGHKIGLCSDERLRRVEKKRADTAAIMEEMAARKFLPQIRRPEGRLADFLSPEHGYMPSAVEQAEIQIKYEGYLSKEQAQVKTARAMEARRLPQDAPYMSMDALRIEARQKLSKQKPLTLGQASRIPGVSPADIAVLTVWLKRRENADAAQQ